MNQDNVKITNRPESAPIQPDPSGLSARAGLSPEEAFVFVDYDTDHGVTQILDRGIEEGVITQEQKALILAGNHSELRAKLAEVDEEANFALLLREAINDQVVSEIITPAEAQRILTIEGLIERHNAWKELVESKGASSVRPAIHEPPGRTATEEQGQQSAALRVGISVFRELAGSPTSAHSQPQIPQFIGIQEIVDALDDETLSDGYRIRRLLSGLRTLEEIARIQSALQPESRIEDRPTKEKPTTELIKALNMESYDCEMALILELAIEDLVKPIHSIQDLRDRICPLATSRLIENLDDKLTEANPEYAPRLTEAQVKRVVLTYLRQMHLQGEFDSDDCSRVRTMLGETSPNWRTTLEWIDKKRLGLPENPVSRDQLEAQTIADINASPRAVERRAITGEPSVACRALANLSLLSSYPDPHPILLCQIGKVELVAHPGCSAEELAFQYTRKELEAGIQRGDLTPIDVRKKVDGRRKHHTLYEFTKEILDGRSERSAFVVKTDNKLSVNLRQEGAAAKITLTLTSLQRDITNHYTFEADSSTPIHLNPDADDLHPQHGAPTVDFFWDILNLVYNEGIYADYLLRSETHQQD